MTHPDSIRHDQTAGHAIRAFLRGLSAAALCAGLIFTAQALPARASDEEASSESDATADAPVSGKNWDITAEHGPVETVSFTTDEGTWLSLDVHPDGRTIVFSLLGDLYLLPIEGGEARRISSGPAYDVQPRFSPDGQWIAFGSDRKGTENLWICDLEGDNARQISTEKGTEVTDPAWSPDGEWLMGRRRFTDLSSLGRVELWMWHLKGGEGVQITDKDKLPDVSEAVFSSDERFVYFTASSGRFQYNRDVYDGIWQIQRFDRVTGQTVPLTGESGGAAAPALSPDGRHMAFVRRVSARTRLEIMDLATGRTRLLADGVTRDQQQGFATHGIFPGYDWTPDGREIVATADGKIWRWDVETGRRRAVPFTAAVEQTVHHALRFPHALGGETVRSRILRWPVESPDGEWLVFSAIGHLYAMRVPDGTPRRLTASDDFEFAPAFSPDGRTLAYVTWNDDEGGHVRTMPFRPGRPPARSTRLTRHPGHYVNPAFSADGSRLVYVKGSGAAFRDQNLSSELWHEIHWIPAAGGEPNYVIGVRNRGPIRKVTRPAFTEDGERIWFLDDRPSETRGQPSQTVLASAKVDGTDLKEHLRWAHADEAIVSPDGRWVVYNELHDAFVTALPRAGDRTIDVAAKGGALPVARLTDEGGEWVRWVDGGKTLSWIRGPHYHRLSFEDAFPPPEDPEDADAEEAVEAEPEDAEEEEDEEAKTEEAKKPSLPESDSFEIVLEVPRAKPAGTTAYTGARIVTMKGDEVIERGTIVVTDDRIAAVGRAGTVDVPRGARTVDVSGRTIIPGLFDEHAHLHYSELEVYRQRPWQYLANLAYGVTSTHDVSAPTHESFSKAEMVEAGLMPGPRIFSTGFVLYGADLPNKAVVTSLDDARKHIRRMKNFGAITVKSYMQPRREQRQWVVQAAREEEIMVVPEGGGDLESNMTMILDGHTTIEHSLPVAPIYKDVVTLFARSGTAYTPTLLVAYGGLSGEHWFYQHYDVWKDERLLRYTPQGVIDRRARVRDLMADDDEWHHMDVAAGAKAIVDAGGRACLGGHGQLQGLGPHWEMWAFAQGGMTPLEALRVSTLFPAEALGLDGDLGSIEPGKLADFVVLDRNPLEKIENTDSVRMVVKNGVAWDPAELARHGFAAPDSTR